MVGIPGKSKGCITCRRRKIRVRNIFCAEVEAARLISQVSAINGNPIVLNVLKAGETVKASYAKYPTFLNQTINGPEKRHGLEEAKPRQSISGPSSSAALSRISSPSRGLQLSRSPSNTEIYDVQLVAQFWQAWVPIKSTTSGDWDCPWLQQAISVQNSTLALDLSIKALAFTRLGWLNHDTALATRGGMLYGQALCELQKCLWDEQRMWLDETLVAAYALSVYELFETTTSSIKGWNSHLSGLGNLVRLRGPRRHQSSLGRTVLEAYRFSSMIQSIQFRKKSFLLESDWRERPWDYDEKNVQQRLYDHGFELGALQNQIDDAGLQRGEMTPNSANLFLGNLNDQQAKIDAWYQDFHSSSPSLLYWASNTPFRLMPEQQPETAVALDNVSFHGSFMFPNLRLATVTITYWALKIAIAGTFHQLLNRTAQSSPSPQPGPISPQQQALGPDQQTPHTEQQPPQPAFTFAQPDSHFGDYRNLPSRTPLPIRNTVSRPLPSATEPSNDPITNATNIMRTMPFCLSDEQGIFGASQSLFALRAALFILRLNPGVELTWCKSIYRILEERKGLRYAKEIAKLDGGHGTRGNERGERVTPVATPPPRTEIGPYTVAQDKFGH